MTVPPRWRFRQMTPSEINQDPVQGEFFTAAADLAERLVRESIQNSLDARADPNHPVHVRFAFSGPSRALPIDRARRYLNGLHQHLTAVREELDADIAKSGRLIAETPNAYEPDQVIRRPMNWLVVEDFGTDGLLGDIESNSEYEDHNHFWGFFRSIGISPKGDDHAGAWGLGKWVFPDASLINAYLGLTRRRHEHNLLLMGMAILKTHHTDNGKHPPYGQFAADDARPDAGWLPMPVDSHSDHDRLIEHAVDDFHLRRPDGSGLSVVIPYPKDELTPPDIARAVLTQYFFPIVRNDLIVEIEHPDHPACLINADNIDEHVQQIAPPKNENARDDETVASLSKAVDLARWALSTDADKPVMLTASLRSPLTLPNIESLRERYADGHGLAFQLATNVAGQGSKRAKTTFHVYLQRDDQLAAGHDYFIRGHLRIPNMDHIRSHKARALILVGSKSPLGHLLRDAEGPAHANWDPHAQRLKERWRGGYGRVQEVRRAALLLLQQLAEPPKSRLQDLLADVFPRHLPAAASDSGSTDGGSDDPVTVVSNRSPIEITQLSNGFSVAGRPHQHHDDPNTTPLAGSAWRVAFAYDTARGGQRRAFTLFQQGVKDGCPDFSLKSGKLSLAFDGCGLEINSENELNLDIHRNDFRLSVTGLDDRDVIVQVQPNSPTDQDPQP